MSLSELLIALKSKKILMPKKDYDITNRKDAVACLNSKGFHAFIRDWVMGETIGVMADELPVGTDGIQGWRYCVYIHLHDSKWAVSDLSVQTSNPRVCCSLTHAVEKAAEILNNKMKKNIIDSNLIK